MLLNGNKSINTKLKKLTLYGCDISNADLEQVEQLTQLEELNLGKTVISDEGLSSLKALTGLKRLDLTGTRTTDAGLLHLKGLTNLESLNLRETLVLKQAYAIGVFVELPAGFGAHSETAGPWGGPAGGGSDCLCGMRVNFRGWAWRRTGASGLRLLLQRHANNGAADAIDRAGERTPAATGSTTKDDIQSAGRRE